MHGVAAIALLPYAKHLAATPKAALAAVVVVAVAPGVARPTSVLELRGGDAFVAWATAAASTLTDPTTGFLTGLALATATHTTTKTGPRPFLSGLEPTKSGVLFETTPDSSGASFFLAIEVLPDQTSEEEREEYQHARSQLLGALRSVAPRKRD